MYVIETELGRFEAETEKDAKKQLRAAERKAVKQREIDLQNSDTAQLRGRSVAFGIAETYIEGKAHIGWRYYLDHERYSAKQVADPDSEYQTYVHAETEWGNVKISVWGATLMGSLMNGAGFTIAIWLRDNSSGEVAGYAVGLCENQYHLAILPNAIQPEFFYRGTSCDSSDGCSPTENLTIR